jgi:hypothetical protein
MCCWARSRIPAKRCAPRSSVALPASAKWRRTSAPGAKASRRSRSGPRRCCAKSSAPACVAAAAPASPPRPSGPPAAPRPPPRYVVCNADEGEPGTFKDRVLLSRHPDLVFDGMTVAAYCIGAQQGLVYLRGEYRYLLEPLEALLEERRRAGLLGRNPARPARLRFRHRHPRRRGLVRVRRGICAARIAGRQARHPAQPPALPGHARLPRPADRGQQCRDAVRGCPGRAARRRVVPLDRHSALQRHQAAVGGRRLRAARVSTSIPSA